MRGSLSRETFGGLCEMWHAGTVPLTNEIKLGSGISKVDATVRRPAGTWTGRVQMLMADLRLAGLGFVPEPFGTDESNREIVEFIEGDVPHYPMPEWVWTDELLVEVARATRRLHDVSRAFDLSAGGWRREAIEPREAMSHGDLAPYNTVCQKGRFVALIDWDYAIPAPIGWDLADLAYRWVSLTSPDNPDGRKSDVAEQLRRLALMCGAYGDVDLDYVVTWVTRRLDDAVTFAHDRAAAGEQHFIDAINDGHTEIYRRDAEWVRANF
jgi:hypothetical protein